MTDNFFSYNPEPDEVSQSTTENLEKLMILEFTLSVRKLGVEDICVFV